ncbi:calcium/calmodulin-dependent 3',5'-cyclic nucleotide phosphodiesterase 1C isoform X2 [Larimichthys crocea]|uniref:calcium/calmodulin-dependent 3',5'-cyclic nucleotide phosphodiesterase 1C isoform X2 n=1 Tax=Larimichthys crocea TaxID=215358 RepID=UPI000901FAE2|nr:calcium/calmodulin-dependent 3',5'-cyclic nucleotide phosphodiesterase 1C isoform X2 [Larimichthys crocea]
MTERTSKKQGFKKCRSATFSIDGFSFTIVANEAGESHHRPLVRFARSRSQNALCTAVTPCTGITDGKGILMDPRSTEEILADELPVPDEPDAMEKTAIRLRCLVKQLERGEASVMDLKKNLEYAASVLESLYMEETRRLVDPEDELSDIQSDSVPSEVRDWLASTFTRQRGLMLRRSEDKPRFRSIVHAVQAGIFVERMYRRTSNMAGLSYPSNVITVLKQVDMWSFDVFALNEASGDHALKFVFYELLTRYDLINRFKVPVSALISFVDSLEVGYSKYKNPYHNLMHAADVTQTIHYLLLKTGMVHWLTELEIFAIIFAAAIHDFDHTGTTNNFHIQTRSDTAMLYNDRAVLENHHVSAAYRLLQDDDEMNILSNLSKDDWSVNSISGSDGKHSSVKSTGSEGSCSLTTVDFKSFKVTWTQEIRHNKDTWKAQAAKDLEAKKEANEGDHQENEAEEKKESKRTVDRPSAGQEDMNTDIKGQEEAEDRKQQEEQHPKEEDGPAAGSLLRSGPNLTDKKNTGMQQQQCQNEPQPDCPLIYYYKRPSYCASSYRLLRSKVTEMRPIDARGKARRLQRISLRRRK